MKKRKLFILFHGRFPSEKAAALFVAENARSFSSAFDVQIIAPRRLGRGTVSMKEAYGTPEQVQITYLPVLDLFYAPFLSHAAFYISMLTYLPFAISYLVFRASKKDCIISNDFILGLAATITRAKVVFEVHDYPEHWKGFYGLLFKRAALTIATNEWKYEQLLTEFPHIREHLVMERNAVDLTRFGERKTKSECRRVLDLPFGQKIVVYTGHLYSWKGIATLIEAGRAMPDTLFYFVGGTPKETEHYRKENTHHKNIIFTGHIAHKEVSLWQGCADVLVLPNTAREEISAHYTSPMKLFEYMASGRPIVASSIPSITEVLNEDMAFFFEPDSADSLTTTLTTVLSNVNEAQRRAQRAAAQVQQYSWSARAERLCSYMPFK